MARIVRSRTRPVESRQSDNGHVGFMRTSSRSSSVVTRTVDHGGMPDRTLAFDAATDAAIDAELFSNRSQLSVARTLPIPFAAAVAGVVGLTRPPCPIDRRWQRDSTGPFDRSDLASARAHGRLPTGRRDHSDRDRARAVGGRRHRARDPAGRARASALERASAAALVRICARRRRRAPPTDHRGPATRAASSGNRRDRRASSTGRVSGSPGPSFAPRMDGPGGFAIFVNGSARSFM